MQAADRRRVVVGDREYGGARAPKRGASSGISESQIDGLVAFKDGIIEDRNANSLIGSVAIGKADGLGRGRVVGASGGRAVAGSETNSYCAGASACARDGDCGAAAVLVDAVGGRAKLQRACRRCFVVDDSQHGCAGASERGSTRGTTES